MSSPYSGSCQCHFENHEIVSVALIKRPSEPKGILIFEHVAPTIIMKRKDKTKEAYKINCAQNRKQRTFNQIYHLNRIVDFRRRFENYYCSIN